MLLLTSLRNMSLYEETKFLMKKYGIFANKNLGQNFLIDETVVDDIVESACITKEDFVIEIGPGLGTLTNKLLEEAGKVLAIELDPKMANILKERFAFYTNFELLEADVLKVNLKEIISKEQFQKVKIVANLPYYITTPILMKLLEEKLEIESITVMIQKEVADRLVAMPGSKNGGAITYAIHYYTEPRNIRLVESTCFIPEPEVQSEIISLKIRKEISIQVKSEEKFFKLIKVSFMQRRKTFVNSVANSGLAKKEKIVDILKQMQIDERVRGESLTMEQFAKISDEL